MENPTSDEEADHWLMLLGWIGLVLSVLTITPNIVIVIILSRTKIISDILVNFRLCACADILCAILFLVFIYPSWYQHKMTFDPITCAIEGVLSMWVGLNLPYSIVYLMFQRHSQYQKQIGWKESKTCFAFPLFVIWSICGFVSVLPCAFLKTSYAYKANHFHCVLADPWLTLAFDVVQYAIPSLLFFVSGTLLRKVLSKPIKRIQTSRNRPTALLKCYPLERKESINKSRRHYIGINDVPTYYPIHPIWNDNRINNPLISAIENHLMGLETRYTFIYTSYASGIFTFAAFFFRLYGMYWSIPVCKSAILASPILIFAAGIARSIIPILFSQAATKYLSGRYIMTNPERHAKGLDLSQLNQQESSSEYYDSQSSRFLSFTLFMNSSFRASGTHSSNNGMREMEDFWFKNDSAIVVRKVPGSKPASAVV